MMDTVPTGLKRQTCPVYLNDVVVFYTAFEQHFHRLRSVLEAIRSADPTLKPHKCHFGYEELEFLGHVSAEGVRLDPDKLVTVAESPAPVDKKAVWHFPGLCAYYRRFIYEFSQITEPLIRLTRDDTPFVRGNKQQAAFDELRQRTQSAPVLAHFDHDSDTEAHTNASNIGLGAVLVLRQDDIERLIAYASRSLSRAEANYFTTEKGCIAAV